VRPGLIVGPWDPSDRFTYWPRRFDLGGEAIVPATSMKVQLADGRDISEWMVRMAAAGTTGTFNACGPKEPWTFDEMIEACVRAAGDNAATPVRVDEEFLLENEVMGWGELPVWLPEAWGMANMLDLDVSAAVNAGLTFRPLDTVVADTLAWDRTRREAPMPGALSAEKEADVLQKWKAR
jgi:2'-hydroxyisoflavone reductase